MTRSQMMSRIRSRDTKPEMAVRRALHAAGLRYRLHVNTLPGTPDIVLHSRRVVVEVRGCFWHQHHGCPRAPIPATGRDYWLPKLSRNIERDEVNEAYLVSSGWQVFVVWECEVRNAALLAALIQNIRDGRRQDSVLSRVTNANEERQTAAR